MMKTIMLLLICIILLIVPAIIIPAWSMDGGDSIKESKSIITSDLLGLSEDQIKQAKELFDMLMKQDDTKLIIYKNSENVCKYLDCSNLDTSLIASLSDSILRQREQKNRIFWTVVAVGIALCSLVVSLLSFILSFIKKNT